MKKINCPECGKEFLAKSRNNLCSDECRKERLKKQQKNKYKVKRKELNIEKNYVKNETNIPIPKKLIEEAERNINKEDVSTKISVQTMFEIQKLIKNKNSLKSILERFKDVKEKYIKLYYERIVGI